MKAARIAVLERRLEWQLSVAATPALWVAYQDNPEDLDWLLSAARAATGSANTVPGGGGAWLAHLRAGTAPAESVDIVLLGLSSIPPAERMAFNASREHLLALGRKIIFVEPAEQAVTLARDFPDVLSCARDVLHAESSLLEQDYLFDSGPAGRLDTLARGLQHVIAVGETLIIEGQVHTKSEPRIECPRCGQLLKRGTTRLVFIHAPAATREQEVAGWVCSCGESYVPGEVARAAHARAFKR